MNNNILTSKEIIEESKKEFVDNDIFNGYHDKLNYESSWVLGTMIAKYDSLAEKLKAAQERNDKLRETIIDLLSTLILVANGLPDDGKEELKNMAKESIRKTQL